MGAGSAAPVLAHWGIQTSAVLSPTPPPQDFIVSPGIAWLTLLGYFSVPGAVPSMCPGPLNCILASPWGVGGRGQALLSELPRQVTCQEVAEPPGDSLIPDPCSGSPSYLLIYCCQGVGVGGSGQGECCHSLHPPVIYDIERGTCVRVATGQQVSQSPHQPGPSRTMAGAPRVCHRLPALGE